MSSTKSQNSAAMPGPNLGKAIADRIRGVLRSRIALAIFIGLTSVAVVAEPFDTHDALQVIPRVFYWSIVVGVSVLAGAVFDEISLRNTDRPEAWGTPLRAAAMMALAYTPFIYLVSKLFTLFGASLAAYPPRIFLYVLVVSLTVYCVIHVVRPHLRDPEAGAPPAAEEDAIEPVRARLTDRLTCPEVTIYRVSASDHMTEVATDHGVERIRMRFADAVNEMDPVAGSCVHRSHWVALSAVTGLEKRDGKLFVQLINGEELPISRTYRPELEAAMPELF